LPLGPTVIEGTDGGSSHVIHFTIQLDKTVPVNVGVNFLITPPGADGNGADVSSPLAGTAVILAGSSSVVVDVAIVQDHFVEFNEPFSITLTDAINAVIDPAADTATITIIDDDLNPVAVDDTNWVQEDSAATATGNVLENHNHPGAPVGAFADVQDVDTDPLQVTNVNPITGTWLGDTRDDAMKKLAGMPMQAKPGETWSYNQTNYMLLGMLVEKYSGMSFDDFIMQKIAKPLMLSSATYGDSRVVVPNRGSWYSIIDFSSGRPKRAKSAYPTWVTYPGFIHTAAGLNMTSLDLARFADAVAGGRILKQPSVDQMWTAVKLNDGTTFRMEKTLGVGLGWIVDDIPGHRAVGGTGGSTVAFRHFRDDNITVVVMTNLQGIDPDAMVDSIAALYIPALKTAASLPGS